MTDRRTFLRAMVAAWLLVPAAVLAEDRALLVGIDRYADPWVPRTPGSRADAEAQARLLRERFGFPAGSIRRLLDSEATAEAIVREFREWLVDGTEPGDRVFFHYSGHGSQLKDQGTDESLDGFDETLAPYDVNPWTGANQIRDDEILELIAGLAGRRVVLVVDACHSGTISRGPPSGDGPGPRYLPSPEQWRELGKASANRGPRAYRVEPAASRDLVRMSFVDSEDLERLSGTVVISAAAADQLAFPVHVGGGYRGALSYVFERFHRGSRPTVRQLREQLRAEIASMQRQGRLPGGQVPEIESMGALHFEDQPLFGDWEQAAAVALTNPLSSARVRLQTVDRRSSYRDGDLLSFEIETDVAGYLYVLVFSQGDRETGCSDCRVATVLHPARDDPDNRIAAGRLRFPRGDEGFVVGHPYGRDLMVALVSSAPLPQSAELGDRKWSEIFRLLGLDELRQGVVLALQKRRGVRRTPGSGEAPKISWQSGTWTLETHP